MFLHNFKYSFKILFRSRALIFWTFAFPIILGIFFKMAFSNIENSEKLAIIDIAIVENQEFKDNFIIKSSFQYMGDEDNNDRLFNIKYVDEDEAKDLLSNDKISGYLKIENNEPKIVVMKSGINETVFKYFTEEILMSMKMTDYYVQNSSNTSLINVQDNSQINTVTENQNMNDGEISIIDYAKIYQNVMELSQNAKPNIENVSNKNLSYTMIEFYTLIAMACLYGGMLGMASINKNLANMSNNGKRVCACPISKVKIVLSSVCASYVTALIGVSLLFGFTIFVLKVNYGDNLPLVALLAACGSLAGLSLGIAIGTCLKAKESVKEGIFIALSMLGCFLSGMMGITMKYIIDKNIPIINKINPASMITDGLYSLYYYDTLDRYFFNLASLLVFSIVLIVLSFFKLRRQKYDSI